MAAMDGAPVRTSRGLASSLAESVTSGRETPCSFRQSIDSSIHQYERNVLAAELQEVSVSGG